MGRSYRSQNMMVVTERRIFDTQSQHILWDKSAHSMSQSLSFLCCPQICKNTDSRRARHTQNIIGVKGHLWNADLCWCVATAGSADRNSKLQSWRLSKAMLICCTVQLWGHVTDWWNYLQLRTDAQNPINKATISMGGGGWYHLLWLDWHWSTSASSVKVLSCLFLFIHKSWGLRLINANICQHL